MESRSHSRRLVLLAGIALVAVLMAGAVLEQTVVPDICMFILAPYFAALVAVYPVLALNRFGTGILVYILYVLVGIAPMSSSITCRLDRWLARGRCLPLPPPA